MSEEPKRGAKMIVIRTPEEQAEHLARKEARRNSPELHEAIALCLCILQTLKASRLLSS
jgi:hypothetical protein